MLFTPCLSVLSKLALEFSWKASGTIAVANFFTAVIIGGVVYRIIGLF
jgi:Fe2+ transport system protein B